MIGYLNKNENSLYKHTRIFQNSQFPEIPEYPKAHNFPKFTISSNKYSKNEMASQSQKMKKVFSEAHGSLSDMGLKKLINYPVDLTKILWFFWPFLASLTESLQPCLCQLAWFQSSIICLISDFH